MILDTNGNGKRDEYVEPNQPVDPTKDKRIVGRLLCRDAESGRRLGLGCRTDFPWRGRAHRSGVRTPRRRRSPRSTISRCPALVSAALTSTSKASSGCRSRAAILASFDRRKCKGPLNGPKATGDHCPEGWSFYQYPGPGFQGHRREQRRVELLLLGRSAQHVRPRRRRAHVHRQLAQRPDRA